MLKTPSKHEQHATKLAEFFETLDEDRYDQKHYQGSNGQRCICGWINYLTCHLPANRDAAADYLGLDYEQASSLFASHVFQYKEPTTKLVAKVLRHLAATGEVEWRL